MRAKRGARLLTVCGLALAAVSCGDNYESADAQNTESTSGEVIAAVTAPPNAKCIVITVQQGTTTLTTQYNVAAEQSSTFNLSGLPEGNDTFGAKAYNVACASVSGATPTYVSDPVTLSVTAAPTMLTLQMRPNSGATGTVSVNFPNSAGMIAEYTVPSASYDLQAIAAGPDGNLWITESNASKIAQVYTWGYVAEYSLPSASAEPYGITAGPDGNIWFTELNDNKIGRLAIATGTVTEYYVLTANAYPYRIAAGSDGNLWFTEQGAGKIGRITPGGTVTEFALAAGAYPGAIVGGSDGNLWFQQSSGIGRITPTGTVTNFSLPTSGAVVPNLALGADGNVWFSEQYNNKIAKVTPAGTFTEYNISGATAYPSFVTA
ncbi:MAG TPA: hypothetical protein VGP64_11660, partial [Polyangia bacterium]